MHQINEKEFHSGEIASRLLKYGVTLKYAAAVSNEIGSLESHCNEKFISKAEIDDLIKHYFVRVEAKLNAARIESLKWYIGISFIQVASIVSTIIAVINLLK